MKIKLKILFDYENKNEDKSFILEIKIQNNFRKNIEIFHVKNKNKDNILAWKLIKF